MKKLLITTTILSSILITPVMAKEKLYAINSGSLTGSHSVMTAAWANDLAEDYDVQIVQAKGCAKTEAILKKLEGQHAIYNYSSNWNSKETCKNVAPTSDSLVYADSVVGLVFTKGENNSSFLTDNISVAYTNDSTAVWLEEVELTNNVKFNKIRYDGSQELVLAVMNGESDFAITTSPKHFFEKSEELKAVYNLSSEEVNGVPSLHTIGASSTTKISSVVYSGPDINEVRSDMVDSYDEGSSMNNYHSVSKGTVSYINRSIEDNWNLVSSNK